MGRSVILRGACLAALLTTVAWAAALAEGKADTASVWKPYLEDDHGKRSDFPADWSQVNDKDWMFLRFTDYTGYKPRLAVMVAGNEKPEQQYYTWTDGVNHYQWPMPTTTSAAGVPVDGIEDLVTIALKNSNRYRLVERQKIENVNAEQSKGASGEMTPQTAAPMGKGQGAQYLIETTVNEWNPEESHAGGGVGRLGVSSLGLGTFHHDKASIKMSFRIIDAATTEIVEAISTKAEVTSGWGITPGFVIFGATADVGGILKLQGKPLMTNAVQACINKSVYQIVMKLKQQPWTGKVADVSGEDITINAGSEAGLKVGNELVVGGKGKDVKNPDTGETIHIKGADLGILVVSQVEDAYSVAHPKPGCDGCSKVEVGCTVRLKP